MATTIAPLSLGWLLSGGPYEGLTDRFGPKAPVAPSPGSGRSPLSALSSR